MNLNNLKPAAGSVKKNDSRRGRGEATGNGGTAGRGHNGQKSRSGYSKKVGFEGGQMPLQRRVPKFGFSNRNRKEYTGINIDTLQAYVDAGRINEEVTIDSLVENRLAGKKDLIKIMGRGELKAKLKITVHKFTGSAKEAIEAAGGEAVTL